MYESMPGISIEKVGVGLCAEKPPTWKSENLQCSQLFHCASLAEIFIGWSSVTTIPKWLPNQRFAHDTGTSTMSASLAASRNSSTFRPRAKCQQQTPKTTAAPTVNPASIVCPNAQSDHLLERSFHTLVSWAWPFTTL